MEEFILGPSSTLCSFHSKPSAWMSPSVPVALYLYSDETDSPTPALISPLSYTHRNHSLLKTSWNPRKSTEFSTPRAEFISSSPFSTFYLFFVSLLSSLNLQRHYHPNCCLSQKGINYSSLLCLLPISY